MCRKYLINCRYCWRSSQPKATIIVNCGNRQHSIWPATIDNSNVIFEVHPPCDELQETREILYGNICHQCYTQDGRPSPDPDEVAMGERIINNLIKSDSILLHLSPSGSTHTQEKIRVEGEQRKELDKIQAAIDSYRATDSESGGEGFQTKTIRLFRLIRTIYIFNLIADADDKYHVYVDNTSLPPLLQEHDLTELTDKDCNICGEDMGKMTPEDTLENPVRATQCGHIFGDRCILTWLNETNNPTCPMCRENFSTQTHRFPDGYDHDKVYDDDEDGEDEDEDEFPDDWLEILVDAASSESATDSREAPSSETGVSPMIPGQINPSSVFSLPLTPQTLEELLGHQRTDFETLFGQITGLESYNRDDM